MADFKIFDTSSLNEDNMDGTYINACFPSSIDISECGKASPEQLTVSTIVGLIDETKEPTKDGDGKRFKKRFEYFLLINAFSGVIIKVESLTNHKTGSITQTASSVSSDSIIKKENSCSVGMQIFIPFMIAGMGTIGAGIVLGNVEVSLAI